jgi:hypothetical protein
MIPQALRARVLDLKHTHRVLDLKHAHFDINKQIYAHMHKSAHAYRRLLRRATLPPALRARLLDRRSRFRSAG